jgi:hypothetical protein
MSADTGSGAHSRIRLSRAPSGRLVLTDAGGTVHDGVVAVRAFPIGAPDEGFSLLSADGHELAWIDRLQDLDPQTRALVDEELSSREFMPQILKLSRVSSYATPSIWSIETDRGATTLVLAGEEDIRRLSQRTLLIEDTHGIFYLVRDLHALDRTSRKLLDRFL